MGRNYKEIQGKKNPNYRTGLAINKNSLYNTWCNMKQRCLNPNNHKYHRYGGRGISICTAWLSIQAFSDWALQNGWREGLSIDRIDNDGDYTPENCRWITTSSNGRKKSTTKITFEQAQNIRDRLEKGESEYDLAREYGVVHGTIWFIKNGFTHVAEGDCSKKIAGRKEV